MAMQTFALQTGRINKFKGEILKHAVPAEVLSKHGRQVEMPRNMSDTYVARRYLPYGATSTNSTTQNRFFVDGNGDRGNAIVALHATAEGITGTPDSIVPVDITVVIQEYSCLYGFTNKTFELYEDDIPAEMKKQVGERVTFVNELILYGALRACTNQYFGGTGTTIATVNGGLTLGLVRKIVKSLQGNHCRMVTSVLKASAKYATDAVSPGYIVVCHTDLEPDIRDLAGFTPTEKYATGTPMPYEVGKVERFRFITSPDLPSIQNGGAAIGATGLYSTTGTSLDVYPMLVLGEDAYSQIAVRGLNSMDPTYLPPGQKSKSDPLGQRGYTGVMWKKAVMIENNGWMSVAFVGSKTLS